MNRERITISLLTDDNDIIGHLHTIKSERTISSYLRHLIRQDMLNNPPINTLDQLAEEIVRKLSNSELSFASTSEKTTKIAESLEDMSIINTLF
ncbi:hypothetical protein [Psychrobacillus sp. FSL K6-1267]|uniref:hypothetical protein n=1 Tax=Psychrobacillus sp. FSL K6-1267 TaxID=2921543 RepID=UPI0030FA8361